MNELQIEERDDFVPVCPYCEMQLDHLVARRTNSTLINKRLVHCCPHCRKVLGVSDRYRKWWHRA
jgi:hypothetical protein